MSLGDALDERVGHRALLARLRALALPDGPRWARAPGAALLALLALQVLTGVAMAFYYAPGTTSAWASVLHIEEQVVLGSFVRGLHAFGASALVVLVVLHGLSAGLRGAYRRPREAVWLVGLLAGVVILGFALTGYLLPWDQKGYWATRVATGIMQATPGAGPTATRAFQGGPELGTLTLTRFYALHTLVLPLTLGAVLALHLWLLARHGAAPPAEGAGQGRAPAPYWPRQAARDGLVVLGVIGAVAVLAAARGAGLEAPADPSSDYPPRPEWYFAPLRQLLMLLPEPVGSHVLPGLLLLALAALPWLDRADRPRRALARALLVVPLVAAAALGAKAYLEDAADPAFQAARERAEEDAALARRLAREGVPPEGASALLWRHPPRMGARLFARHCQTCHPLDGVVHGEQEGPDLTGYLSRAWIEGVIREPRHERYFGTTSIDFMDPLPEEEWPHLPALAAFVESLDSGERPRLDPTLVAAGEEHFYRLECHGCHAVAPGEANLAPTLGGYGSEAWLVDFLGDPGQEHFYSVDNEMPAYGDDLTGEELRALSVFLRQLGGRASSEEAP